MSLASLIQSEKGDKIATLLDSQIHSSLLGNLDEKWLEISLLQNQICTTQDWTVKAKLLNKQTQIFHQIFPNYGKWALDILYKLNTRLRDASVKADQKEKGHLEEAVRTMYKAFSCCLTDRFSPVETSRKWGTYRIVILLLSSYFRLKSINLCANVLRAIEAANDLPPRESFPKGDRVAFSYWAQQDLMFAFTNTKERANKHLILKFLIPLKIKSGVFPTSKLLDSWYDLKSVYYPFIDAIKSGDLKAFDQQMNNAQHRLVEWGVFSVVEQCRYLCLRVLIKKIWLISDESSKLSMELFGAGCNIRESHEPLYVECMLANLIDKGLVKGYLSNEKQMIVLSQKDPFPAFNLTT